MNGYDSNPREGKLLRKRGGTSRKGIEKEREGNEDGNEDENGNEKNNREPSSRKTTVPYHIQSSLYLL
jgi:hypothetical protein